MPKLQGDVWCHVICMAGVSGETLPLVRSMLLACKDTSGGATSYLRAAARNLVFNGSASSKERLDMLNRVVRTKNVFGLTASMLRQLTATGSLETLADNPAVRALATNRSTFEQQKTILGLLRTISEIEVIREETLISRLGVRFTFGCGKKIDVMFCKTKHPTVRWTTSPQRNLIIFADIVSSSKKFKANRRFNRRMASLYEAGNFKKALETCKSGTVACTETTDGVPPELVPDRPESVSAELLFNTTVAREPSYVYYETDQLTAVPLCALRSSLATSSEAPGIYGVHALHIAFHGTDGIYGVKPTMNDLIDEMFNVRSCRERLLPLFMPLVTLMVDATPAAKQALVSAIECTSTKNKFARNAIIFENVYSICTRMSRLGIA